MNITLPSKREYNVGILSDTHGHLSRRLLAQLNHIDLIIHAGDIDAPDVLPVLEKIAPVVAVRGNMDLGTWTQKLAPTEALQVGQVWIYIIHDLARLDLIPEAVGFRVVISGHTHRASVSNRNGTLYINPGSATFPRHPASATMAILSIKGETVEPRLIDLETGRYISDQY